MLRRKDYRAGPKVEAGAYEDGGDAAEGIEEGLGNPATEEGDADHQSANQHRCGADRGSQFDQTLPEPCPSGHSGNSYSANVTTAQHGRLDGA
jgi:hypothetical protein